MTGDDSVPVGECPEHGVVTGDRVNLNFPNTPTCECGRELSRAGVADAEEVNELAG